MSSERTENNKRRRLNDKPRHKKKDNKAQSESSDFGCWQVSERKKNQENWTVPKILQWIRKLRELLGGSKKKYKEEIQRLRAQNQLLVEELNTTKDKKDRLEERIEQFNELQTTGVRQRGKREFQSLENEDKITDSQQPSETQPTGARWTLKIPQGSRDDEYFERQFIDLRFRLAEWVFLAFIARRDPNHLPRFDSLDSSLSELICRLGFDETVLKDERRTRDMIQAIVADKLREYVLSRFAGGYDDPDKEESFRSLVEELSKNNPEKRPSIIQGKMSIADGFAPPENERLVLPEHTRASVRNLVQLLAPMAADPSFNLKKRTKLLEKIFESARFLVIELRKQPYEFSVPSIELGTIFDEKTMEIEGAEDQGEAAGAEDQIVKGVIFPALERAGLESVLPRVIVKASVLVQRSSHTATAASGI